MVIIMNMQDICGKIDHTILQPQCTWDEVKKVCEEAVKYKAASACIPPSFVKEAALWRGAEGNDLKICTVVGFPTGYHSTEVKCFETDQVLKAGADEVDMVIRVGWVKEGKYDKVLDEIKRLRDLCHDQVLKVIIETCLLSEYEKLKMCDIVSEARADFIKTSTGFSKGGATPEDVALLRKNVSPFVQVKAAGGIRSIADAVWMLGAGADRLGSSSLLKMIAGLEGNE